MPIVVSIINLKGGVAKTTTTIQLAECLSSEFNKKVLVIDLDPQTNATISLISEEDWEELDNAGQTLFQLFSDKLNKTKKFNILSALQKGVSNLNISQLDLLASSIKFIEIQDRLGDISPNTNFVDTPMDVLKKTLPSIRNNYDYILIDCPPNLGNITRNGIEVSDYYLIPTIPDFLSSYGIPQIVRTIHDLAISRQLPIRCLGLLMTKYDSRSSSHLKGRQNLPTKFLKIFNDIGIVPGVVFNTIMPQANTTSEAMEYINMPKTFKQKYGRAVSGGQYLYEYVINLTKEFIHYAK